MVFSTVQISMPGTSCAVAAPQRSRQGVKTSAAAKAIRPIIESSLLGELSVNLLRAAARGRRYHTETLFAR
jgi:hypothetical protein